MKTTWTHDEMVAAATADLPTGIDYAKYLLKTTNMYSKSDVDSARMICVIVAKKLLVAA